ncbi:YjjG family noncanonical pyrimidine nucleotidase [uncultured Eudoraea sp.]|jgi:putative hydrolase of the HAD superfamily|uniref:YjjG family noncanonical pyrimidine nucleotidase n=1 Tax=uncultured Eudoraea sp. TaxID=1035614 RepID=UPI00261733EB|nr:YjjG family noncanonical pyrimidine nucleotidase [uncultured Eudoraea sp.]
MYSQSISDIFFDLDHTLWDFEKNSALTFQKIFTEVEIDVNLSEFLEVYIPVNLAFWKLYRDDKIKKPELRFQRLKTTFDAIGYDIEDEVIDILSTEYITNLATYNNLLPYTVEILNYLKPKYKLHIITNGFEEVQTRKLVNSNIFGYFDQVINSEMAGVKKPNPEIFELALKKANTAPDKSLMVGDNIEADILGAKAVGFHALHFNAHNDLKHEHCVMIHSLREIKNYL